MKIGEVAERTGLSDSSIRFYERKGLLTPTRNQNNRYREYQPEDMRRLKEIVLYRKMDLPVETIGMLLNGQLELIQALEDHKALLIEKQEITRNAIDLCDTVIAVARSERSVGDTAAADSVEPLDIDHCLHAVKTAEERGQKFAEIEAVFADFATYTWFDLLLTSPLLYRFFQKPKVYKAARLIWTALLLLIPVLVIINHFVCGQ